MTLGGGSPSGELERERGGECFLGLGCRCGPRGVAGPAWVSYPGAFTEGPRGWGRGGASPVPPPPYRLPSKVASVSAEGSVPPSPPCLLPATLSWSVLCPRCEGLVTDRSMRLEARRPRSLLESLGPANRVSMAYVRRLSRGVSLESRRAHKNVLRRRGRGGLIGEGEGGGRRRTPPLLLSKPALDVYSCYPWVLSRAYARRADGFDRCRYPESGRFRIPALAPWVLKLDRDWPRTSAPWPLADGKHRSLAEYSASTLLEENSLL